MFDRFPESFVIRIGNPVQFAKPFRIRVVLCPFLKQFLKARPYNAGQTDLGLFRGRRSQAALDDVLLARTRCLHHLVISSIPFRHEPLAKAYRRIINDQRLFVGEKVPVTSVWRNESFGHWHCL